MCAKQSRPDKQQITPTKISLFYLPCSAHKSSVTICTQTFSSKKIFTHKNCRDKNVINASIFTCCFLFRFTAPVCSINIRCSHMREKNIYMHSSQSTPKKCCQCEQIINGDSLQPWTSIAFNTTTVASVKVCGWINLHNVWQLWGSGHLKNESFKLDLPWNKTWKNQ